MSEDTPVPGGVDATRPSPARMYDYILGGKDNFAVDREAVEHGLALVPNAREVALANRGFLGRAVRFLAESGVRQFVDVGTGLPTQSNVHEVAQGVDPRAHVVYVDNDPIVTAHSRALLSTDPRTVTIEGDMRRPDEILRHPELRAKIDFDEPVGLLFVAVLHFLRDDEDPAGLVSHFRDALAPRSHLVISHAEARTDVSDAAKEVYERATAQLVPRTREQVTEYFAGFDLLEPGVVAVDQWRPDGPVADQDLWGIAGVGRKTALG